MALPSAATLSDLKPAFELDDPAHESFRNIEGGFPLFKTVVEG
jgi:hypothetical protein